MLFFLSLAGCHRTTCGKFFDQGIWNIKFAWKGIRKFVIRKIYEGHLNGLDNAVVLLCWYESDFKKDGARCLRFQALTKVEERAYPSNS